MWRRASRAPSTPQRNSSVPGYGAFWMKGPELCVSHDIYLHSLFTKRATAMGPDGHFPGAAPGCAHYNAKLMVIEDTEDLLRRSVQAHEAGDLVAAEAGYRDVLAADPWQPDATHYLGMITYQRGDLDRAVELVEQAAMVRRDDPALAANLGLLLRCAGRMRDAATTLERAVRMAPGQPEAWYNLALVHGMSGSTDRALACGRHVLDIAPGHRQARMFLARLLAGNRRLSESRALLEEGVALDPDDAELQLELAQSLELDDEVDEATRLYRTIADDAGHAGPLRGRALSRLSTLLRRYHRPASSLMAARSAVWADPDNADSWRALGQALKESGRLRAAAEAFRHGHGILRAPGSEAGADRWAMTHVSIAKLRHDIEQLQYLQASGLTEQDFGAVVTDYKALLDEIGPQVSEGQPVTLPETARRRISGTYNRCLHYRQTPSIPGGALSGALDSAAIAADYRANRPGLTWIDNFLGPEALEALRRFCLESTIWYDLGHSGGYLGAYLQEGFDCPLLIQIAEDLPRRLPEIFGDHFLMQLWAYKYDSRLTGIDMHADFAAINVNFWLTPDASMLDTDSGGMVIWDREAPADWSVDEYNTYDPDQQARIRNFLDEQQARRIVVPHRQNRCVIFNSDLFHRTDDIHFRDNYEDRRINVTMLYGTRDDDRRGRQDLHGL